MQTNKPLLPLAIDPVSPEFKWWTSNYFQQSDPNQQGTTADDPKWFESPWLLVCFVFE